jgi:hypothetical protein
MHPTNKTLYTLLSLKGSGPAALSETLFLKMQQNQAQSFKRAPWPQPPQELDAGTLQEQEQQEQEARDQEAASMPTHVKSTP